MSFVWTVPRFLSWLERKTNSTAEYCTNYVSWAGEAPPEEKTELLHVLRGIWDGYHFLVLQDNQYRNFIPVKFHGDSFVEYLKALTVQYPDVFATFQHRIPTEWLTK